MLINMKPLRLLLAAVCLTALLPILPGVGQASDDREAARQLLQSGEILELETILQKARAIQPGRVLEVEFEAKKQRYVYEIEILDEAGVVHELKLDATNGELLKIERED